jgi:hypothetical protein
MADISMCLDHECPIRKYCKRYTAITSPSGWQCYGDFKRGSRGQCDDFMDTRKPVKVKTK